MSSDLFDEHRAILTCLEDIARAVERKPRIALADLSRKRVQLSNLIKVHRIAEEREVLAPLNQPWAAELLPTVKPMMIEIRALWTAYSEHVRFWTPKAIEADWDNYAGLVVKGLDYLKGMMAREEAEIYQPVLQLVASMQGAHARAAAAAARAHP